jgi:hypothetical protein
MNPENEAAFPVDVVVLRNEDEFLNDVLGADAAAATPVEANPGEEPN